MQSNVSINIVLINNNKDETGAERAGKVIHKAVQMNTAEYRYTV